MSKRIFYFDALRALAILSVLAVHIFDGHTFYIVAADYGAVPSFNWFLAVFVNNGLRIGVDLFLMLAGALSLGRQWSITSFLERRIPRIVLPFVFWGFVLSIFLIAISYFFSFGFIQDFSAYNCLLFIYNAYMVYTQGFYPYWFFWVILGTYLIMPIFNKWLLHSDLKEAEYFLCIWLFSATYKTIFHTDFIVTLVYFSAPIALVILGYYLRHTKRKLLNNPYFGIFLILASLTSLMTATYFLSDTVTYYKFSRYSIGTIVEVVGIFILFKNFDKLNMNFRFLKNPEGIFRKFTLLLARYSYGIYLVHGPVIVTFLKIFLDMGLHYKALVFSLFFSVLISSILILFVFDKIPYVRDIIGVK